MSNDDDRRAAGLYTVPEVAAHFARQHPQGAPDGIDAAAAVRFDAARRDAEHAPNDRAGAAASRAAALAAPREPYAADDYTGTVDDLLRKVAAGALTPIDARLWRSRTRWARPVADAGLLLSAFYLDAAQVNALEKAQGSTLAPLPTGTMPDGQPENTEPRTPVAQADWIEQARAEARRYIDVQQKRDLFPSQTRIGDEVARVLRERGIVGVDGKPLSGATIKRHALKGISSAAPRLRSIVNLRGK